jgi:hypothetical protein
MSGVEQALQRRVEESDDLEFAASSPQAIINTRAAGSGGQTRPEQAPEQAIDEYRLIADTDPHVSEAVDTLVDYLVGAGFSIQPANVPGTDTQQTDQDIADLKLLIETSSFERELIDWVWHALVDGTGFLEIVVEDDHFKPKVLPTEQMEIETDEFGNITRFVQAPGGAEDVEFEPHEVAILRFHRHPDQDFGHSVVEPVQEQADMLRDMEIDTARFVATKAYPPILWKCGTEERPWTQQQIDEWLNQVGDIEPESMLAVGHDVEADVVGVTSTSSTAGAMRLEETFKHLIRRIATGTGVPADLLNQDTLSGSELQVMMPKFDRRIQRYRMIIKDAVRYQIFPSIMENATAAEFDGMPPNFEFGTHSSEEERLETDKALRLINNGMLTREAAAKRMGIDPEVELPSGSELQQLIQTLQQIAGIGDDIQNPDGGRPTDTGGGTQSAGREATTRQNPADDQSGNQDRPQQAAAAQEQG